ncbi:MAG: decaprenyl-phosphate phosphoribosyltransferase [bacterium]|nr:decaprenyl-phosphate phosphoribosyltransferase [bacterium]
MATTLIAIIKSVRPRQWLKNLTLFAGIIFSHRLFYPNDFYTVCLAVLFFSLATSAIYLFNDIIDAPHDRLHPFKKKRPIASGELPIPLAATIATTLLILSLSASFILSQRFFLAVIAYLILQTLYMSYLKHVIILDVLTIASGFLLRIYAGVWVIGTHVSIWFLLFMVSSALFLAVGKRRAEATLLSGYNNAQDIKKVRPTLGHYPESLLHSYTTMFATATWLTYALFAFNQPAITPNTFFQPLFYNLTPRVTDVKWLMVTIPFVIFGVMRYLYLIFERKEGESPERVLLSDMPLLSCVVIWGFLVIGVLYVVSG